ncbi:hypothetical protein [Haloarcula argentinensis]|uniref:Transposase n=1 Tax=Haloarcula argentinensis TaxID=43776 RepID=A0ABU2F4T2_HALAR|nr:hypothetical protein [Haloarcula argentinensis]MDS0255573.1 hypothetical protein [Haloarcula argentinensis]
MEQSSLERSVVNSNPVEAVDLFLDRLPAVLDIFRIWVGFVPCPSEIFKFDG